MKIEGIPLAIPPNTIGREFRNAPEDLRLRKMPKRHLEARNLLSTVPESTTGSTMMQKDTELAFRQETSRNR